MNLATAPETDARPARPATDPAIAIRGMTYAYGDRLALDDLSLSVLAGSIFGLLGPNGSGKSTLLSVLIGRRAAARGEMQVLGEPLSVGLRSRMGIVFQDPSLDPGMTVRETMDLQARMFGLSKARAASQRHLLLDRVALTDRTDSMTAELSGGMKRRLELARALINDPDLILLDEPTLALDLDSRQALWQHLLDVNAAGCTLLLATNDVQEAERYCRRVALIDRGRLVAEGTPAELKRGLRHDAVSIEWKQGVAPSAEAIADWPGVGSTRVAGGTTHVTVDEASPFLARLFDQFGQSVHGVQIEEATLEDVYVQLVGRGMSAGTRDGEDET